MQANGGSFYQPRSSAFSKAKEQCLLCHGPGTIASISDKHMKRQAGWELPHRADPFKGPPIDWAAATRRALELRPERLWDAS